jgi:tripartite-type tricarboxylate transporter receptor subunit TctC
MDRKTRRTLVCALALAALALACASAALPFASVAQPAWPNRPVTIISPYNPGGTNDIPARILADELQKTFGQPFIVKNVPGAAGIVGTQQVMNAPADGYTLLLSNSAAMLVQPVVKNPRPYDPAKNFSAIAKVADAYAFVGVPGDLPVKNVGELVALAKQQPGKLNYTSAGIGSAGHFIGEYFKLLTGTDIVHVPSKGSAAGVMDMKAGRIQLMFDALVVPQSSDGRVKVLAVVAKNRLAHLPNIPSMKEAGGPDMEITGWFGLFGPSNMPHEITAKLEAAIQKVVADPETRKKFIAASIFPHYEDGAGFHTSLQHDLKLHEDIKKRANLTVD